MEATFEVTPKLRVNVTGGNQKELFYALARTQEVFGNDKCGACNSPHVRFVVREVSDGKKEHKYYEIHCTNFKCRAKLAFGQHATGDTLFPKRKDDDGWLENNGWTIWEGHKKDSE